MEEHTPVKLLRAQSIFYMMPLTDCVCRLQDSPNRRGVMGSKASGEPSLLLSVSILHALRAAVKAARQEVGLFACSTHLADLWN